MKNYVGLYILFYSKSYFYVDFFLSGFPDKTIGPLRFVTVV